MPGVFPDYPAPVVRNTGVERELTMMRWGMPPPPRAEGLEMRSFANDRRLIQLKSAGLVKHDALANIKPSFENDTNIVAVPPQQSAFSNCVKIVECYVKVYRKQA